MAVFAHYNLIGAFGLNSERLSQLLLCVEATYCFDPDEPNSYHTHVHAADVTLTVRGTLGASSRGPGAYVESKLLGSLEEAPERGPHGLARVCSWLVEPNS